ncbi:hypothetical protein [Spiroplasma endosymbiont of Virgichneumon dumeticola]|uniref:hypothetical protein n=1 Tax=Spiroplasma endosymbiont of Virgichneumon dumeticola TaxID=3139323 RepID=UPI0035C8A0D1
MNSFNFIVSSTSTCGEKSDINLKIEDSIVKKNNHLSSRKKFIGVEIFCYDKRIFLLFNEYENAITFVTNIIMLS